MKLKKRRLLIVGSGPVKHPIWHGLLQAVEQLRNEKWEVLHLWLNHDPKAIQRDVGRFQPQAAIVCGCQRSELVEPFRDHLQRIRGPRGYWLCDLRPARYRAHQLRGMFTHTFLCWSRDFKKKGVVQGRSFSHAEWREGMGASAVHFMPQGSAVYPDPPVVSERWRNVFIGNIDHPGYHYGRRKMCHELRTVVMNGRSRTQRADIEVRMAELYRQGRYALSTSPLVAGYTSVRTHKIMAVGGLMLLHTFPDAQRMFRDGEHALHFRDIEHAKKVMAAWDARGHEAREKVRIAAQQLQRRKHTVYHRVLNMYANMTGQSREFWGWL